MKTMRWMITLAAMGAIASACSVQTNTDDDDGAGGTGSGGATSSTMSGSTMSGSTMSGSTMSGSTMSGSTTSGGSSGCALSPFNWNDAACGNCVESNCCPELEACGIEPKCIEYWQCTTACVGDPAEKACVEACGTTHPEGKVFNDAINSCMETKCSMDCPQSEPICDSGWVISGTGDVETCATCLGDNCCTEYTACANDSDCSDCKIGSQSQASCDASTLDEAVDNCRANNCTVQCGD